MAVTAAGNDEGVDIIAASGKDLGDPHQDPRLVIDQNGDGVDRRALDGGRCFVACGYKGH